MPDNEPRSDDAATNPNGSPGGARASAASGVARFTSDVVGLAELQVRLALVNTREALEKARTPLIVIALAAIVFAGAVTVGLFGVALILASALAIAPGWTMIALAWGALALVAPTALFAGARLRRSLESFRGSREELERNLNWLQAVLDSAPTEPAHRAK